ncbi:MAG: uracil-DNA glycosylase [Bacteroidetes bacterium]|nr:uracil-DNA glycosylase [Bacteroidota bacterium]
MVRTIPSLHRAITHCSACPRLVEWRERVAAERTKRFAEETYWGRPVPGFGDPKARLLLVGLAPAAHGANRTGRMFTGDESGRWLYRALHKAGLASAPVSHSRKDGMELKDCYITAACRCAPPQNKPLPEELQACRPFLLQELTLLTEVRIVIGLGKIGFDTAFDAVRSLGWTALRSRPRFSHGAVHPLSDRITLLGTYHPSQQNTFTGTLTEPMFDAVFRTALRLL